MPERGQWDKNSTLCLTGRGDRIESKQSEMDIDFM